MKVAWHEVPGMHASMIPSRRDGMIRAALSSFGIGEEKPRDLNHAVPYGTKIIFSTLTPMRGRNSDLAQ
jgi:hypothetical protein